MLNKVTKAVVDALRSIVGANFVFEELAELRAYAVSLNPAGDVFPAVVVLPKTRLEVQRIVELANKYRVPLHPISVGLQHGLGMATAVTPGAITMVLSRMNAIIEYDEAQGFVVIEPGVTFAQLYDFLREGAAPYWISPTSGPVEASVLGNALDKGAGYTPLGNHFANLIGLEVVLGDGRLLATGDGALSGAKSAYTHKGGCGPMLDQLFAQSNYGVVTRAGLWLMPAPEGGRGFVFSFASDRDVTRAVDVAGRLKLLGAIPSTVSIANDQFCIGVECATPMPPGTPGRPPWSEADLLDLRAQHKVGAWNVVGCVYGKPSALAARVDELRLAFEATGPVTYIPEEEAAAQKAFAYRFNIAKGIPDATETDVYNIHPNGTALSFLPSIPFRGVNAAEAAQLSRSICTEHGVAYVNQFLCSPRSMRNTQHLICDGKDAAHRNRVQQCFAVLLEKFETAGYLVSRSPPQFQVRVMDQLGMHAEIAAGVKRVFDPNGILAPGRYGIGATEDV
jgi:4-cresol dehydrogenase (hydroxylating) flavoprotein subunit